MASRLSNSGHVVIPYMGHMIAALSNIECYDTFVLSFFEGREDQAGVDCFSELTAQPFKVVTMHGGSD